MYKNKHIGSNFDDFLKEEGIFEEIEEQAAKKIFCSKEKETSKQKSSKKKGLKNE